MVMVAAMIYANFYCDVRAKKKKKRGWGGGKDA